MTKNLSTVPQHWFLSGELNAGKTADIDIANGNELAPSRYDLTIAV